MPLPPTDPRPPHVLADHRATVPLDVRQLAPAPATAGEAPVTLRVLLVEDSPSDAALVRAFLDDPGMPAVAVVRFAVTAVDRLADALAVLAARPVDVVLLDLSLPDADRLEGVEAVVAAAPDVPVVVMTALADDRVALEAVKSGAQDYLVKGADGPREVRRAIRHALERGELLGRERAARAAAERAARARDEVLGIVSHDLRAPLATIVTCAGALAEPDADVASLTDVVARSAEWSLRIIRDLVDVSAIEAGRLSIHPEPMAPDAIADTVASLFGPAAVEAGVRLEVERGEGSPWVHVDVDRMVQALGNLVANAIRFTPRGGRVVVGVGGDDGSAVFRVADTGRGIAPGDVPHLFDRFWQAHETRRGGAGLGLAIARGIVEAHGGAITVDSTPGVGTTFACTVPAMPASD